MQHHQHHQKQARINNQNGMLVVNYKGVERTALTSFLVTVSHFLLYVPTMLVIGLRYSLGGLFRTTPDSTCPENSRNLGPLFRPYFTDSDN